MRRRWSAVAVAVAGVSLLGARGPTAPSVPTPPAYVVEGDTNRLSDVFVHELATGATTRVSVSSGGVQRSACRR